MEGPVGAGIDGVVGETQLADRADALQCLHSELRCGVDEVVAIGQAGVRRPFEQRRGAGCRVCEPSDSENEGAWRGEILVREPHSQHSIAIRVITITIASHVSWQ